MNTLHTELLDAISWAAQQGWTPATGGNYSARTEAGYLVTASGRDKTRIQADDLLLCDLEGRVLEGNGKPSAESDLHARTTASRRTAQPRAVHGPHDPAAPCAGRRAHHPVDRRRRAEVRGAVLPAEHVCAAADPLARRPPSGSRAAPAGGGPWSARGWFCNS